MKAQQPKIDLSRLPLHFRKVNSKWFINGKTQQYIHKDKIHLFLPKEEIIQEPKTYWYNNL